VENGTMDWQLHECRPIRNVSNWSAGSRPAGGTELTLELRPVSRSIGDRKFRGFSYQYFYRSDEIPIYLLLDRGSWELEGTALSSELWMRQSCAPPIYRPLSVGEHYSTEWYLASCTNSNIFQFLPLQTQLQGFTMTAGDAGVLLTWSPKVHHLRTLVEKPRGSDVFVHMHEHCGDLSDVLASAPMEVLFAPGATKRVDRANVHGDMMDLVYDTLHADAGLHREYVPTYGQIEEWTDADLELYRREGLPALAAAGVKHIELANHFQNNMNTWGLSNMCCNVDFKVAESVGEDKLRAFCADAAGRGIRVGMWGNTAIAVNTVQFARRMGQPKRIEHLPFEGSIMEALEKARRPFVINTYGAIESDHYTTSFCVLNLRDPVVREYWLAAWGRLCTETSVTGIFLDSSFNMSSDKFDWRFNADPDGAAGATIDQTHLLGAMRPARTPPSSIETQYYAHLDLVRAMQRQGYVYCNEDCGVFGLHRSGPSVAKRLDNLSMWREFVTLFDVRAIRKAGADPQDVFFQGLAYRMIWSLIWNVGRRELNFTWDDSSDDNRPSEWHLALYTAYNDVEQHMKRRRTILPEMGGVLYSDGPKQVHWSFASGQFPLDRVLEVRDVLSGEAWQTNVLETERHRVYLIG
jgi:hypothetical protein